MAPLKHITVVSWDMAHNAVGRPYFFADMLRRRYQSLLLGPMFPQFGDGIWEPIRKSEVQMLAFPGADLPEYVDRAERAIERLETDVVIACKPRFPGLLIAMLLKRMHGIPVIADLDEWELSWTGANDGLTVDEVESRRGERELDRAYGPTWTRAAEELLGDADAVTVASPVLQDVYGGTIIAQTRDELVFDPGRYDREAVRAEFGYGPDDRVVLFLGTPRRFKGLLELAQALEELGDPRYKLCVIGTIRDPADRIELARVAAGRTQVVEYRPVSEVPRLTVIGDLVCLLQDPTHRTTEHQLPAKLTEVLAMGVPVLARETPPLEPLVRDGLISGIGDVSVATRIAELLSDPDLMRAQAQRGRQYFLSELCYSATLERLGAVFATLEDSRREMPRELGARVRTCAKRPGPLRARPGRRRYPIGRRGPRHRDRARGTGDRGQRVRARPGCARSRRARDRMGMEPGHARLARRCTRRGRWARRRGRDRRRRQSGARRRRNRRRATRFSDQDARSRRHRRRAHPSDRGRRFSATTRQRLRCDLAQAIELVGRCPILIRGPGDRTRRAGPRRRPHGLGGQVR